MKKVTTNIRKRQRSKRKSSEESKVDFFLDETTFLNLLSPIEPLPEIDIEYFLDGLPEIDIESRNLFEVPTERPYDIHLDFKV